MDELSRSNLKSKMISILVEAGITLDRRELHIVESCAIIAESEGNKYKRRTSIEGLQKDLHDIRRSLR